MSDKIQFDSTHTGFNMLASAPTFSNISHHHLATSTSTNSELMQWVNSGRINLDVPYMLTASTQTAGRGQYKRSWQSPIGNLYLSLYHPLNTPVSGLLSLVVGYQLTRLPVIQQLNKALKQAGRPIIGVKWANDIGYYSTTTETHHQSLEANKALDFNKLAGILIEPVITNNTITGVIIGVGINIAISPVLTEQTKEGMDYHAISLNQLLEYTQPAKSSLQLQSRLKTEKISSDNSSPPNIVSQASNASSTLKLRAEDLYMPVGASIIRAVQLFLSIHDTPYIRDTFLQDYNNVSVLTDRQVIIQQRLIPSPATAEPNAALKAEFTTIHGIVRGIHEDGSLKLEHKNEGGEKQLSKIYTGVIRVMSS